MDNLPRRLSCSGWLCDDGRAGFPRLVVDLLGFPHSRAFMNYLSNRPNHWHGMLRLPDVPSHVNAHGPFLSCITGELKRIQLCLKLGSSSYNQRHWTAFHDFSKILAVVCLDEMGSQFCGDSASQCEIACVSFVQLLAHCCNSENRNTVLLALVYKFSKVCQGLVLVGRTDKYREGHRRHVQPKSIVERCCNRLVCQRIPYDASSARNPKDNGHAGFWINRGSENSAGAHNCIRVGQKRFDGFPRLLQLVSRTHEVAMIHGKHHGPARFRLDYSRKPVFHSPVHSVSAQTVLLRQPDITVSPSNILKP